VKERRNELAARDSENMTLFMVEVSQGEGYTYHGTAA
jgi:hypothetical protein